MLTIWACWALGHVQAHRAPSELVDNRYSSGALFRPAPKASAWLRRHGYAMGSLMPR